jgi:CysZ protein
MAAGAGALWSGLTFVLGTSGIRRWALFPAAVVLAVGAALASVGLWAVVDLAGKLWGGPSFGSELLRIAFDLIVGGLAVFAAVLIALALAQPLSGFALDKIADRLEGATGVSRRARPTFFASLGAALGVVLGAFGITIPAVALQGLTFLAPEAAPVTEPLVFALSAFALGWELFDHPLTRRGLAMGERVRWVRARFFSILGFGIAAQLLLLVPGLDLLILPIGVAGATRLLAASERETSEASGEPQVPRLS